MNLNSKLLGGAAVALLAAAFAAPAQAQTTPVYSGGGTLAEKVYRDIFNCYGNQSGADLGTGLVGPQAACNGVAPYRSNVEALYVGVGSGNGKKALVNHDASQYVSGSRVPDAVPVPSTNDFGPFFGTGAGSTWTPGLTNPFPKVSFTGSDDPLTTGDVSTYNTVSGGHWGAPIQVPALITTITVPFTPAANWAPNVKIKIPAGGSSNVQFSSNTLCGIFTGAITQWNDASITADNKGTVLGTGNITVVARADSSGSTFLFTNALLNQCGLTNHPVPAQWIADNGGSTTTSNNSFYVNVQTAGHLPANFILSTGSGGVRNTIKATTGSVGYLSPDFVQPIITAALGGLQAANLQTYNSLVNHLTAKFVAPSAKNGTAIMGGTFAKAPLFTANSCPGVGDGVCAHNPLNWGVANPTPSSAAAYPVGGFTFIDMYTCYAAAADKDAVAGKTAGALGLWTWYFGAPMLALTSWVPSFSQ